MENDLESQRAEQKCRVFHFKKETLKMLWFQSNQTFFLITGPEVAYFSVHVNESSLEYLKFFWQGQLYMFMAFPTGLACCP